MVDRIIDYRKNLRNHPVVSTVKPGDIKRQLPELPPEDPEDFSEIEKDLSNIVEPGLTHWQHPSFFGYFPAVASLPSLLGDMMSSNYGVQGMMWLTSPSCTELEIVVLDWLAHMIGLPVEFTSKGPGGGVIQGTASEAAVIALVAARNRAVKQHGENSAEKMTIYASAQTHSSVQKSCMITGVPNSNYKPIPTNGLNLEMDTIKLKETIEKDISNGKIPILVVATEGTTATGAFDNIEEIAKICQAHNIWLHVDSAWAGSAAICPEYRVLFKGIENADSITMNPHKWLLTGFDFSAFWVKDRKSIIDALSVTPEYLRNKASESGEVIDYRDWQLPLGRRFRSLKIWFVIRSYGTKRMQEFIRGHVEMAKQLEALVRADDRFEMPVPRSLSLVCFRLKHGDSKKLLEAINATETLFLTHAVVNDIFLIRFAIGGYLTTQNDILNCWNTIQSLASQFHSPNQ